MSESRSGKWFVLGLFLITLTAVAFTGGYGLATVRQQVDKANPEYTDPAQSELFWDVWDALKTDYLTQPVEDKQLYYGAISGLAASVNDPYTVFLDPEQTNLLLDTVNGAFEGIGAEIGEQDGQIVVVAPLPGTPAEKAGLLPKDMILKIDDLETTGLSVDEAIFKIRGAEGTDVKLTIYREGDTDLREVTVRRAKIDLPSSTYTTVQAASGEKIGVLTISTVNGNSAEDVRELLNSVVLEEPAGLILDLRNNPGGVLSDAIDITSLLIDSGVVVSEQFNDGTTRSYQTTGQPLLPNKPKLVVLINGGSASAAEIIAGALQDHNRAWLIGTTSFGKGVVQDVREFPDGSALKMTISSWLTPNGRTIQHTGIEPDQVVDYTAAESADTQDSQMQAAIDYLVK